MNEIQPILEFVHVDFGYDRTRQIFTDLNMTVQRGETIGIVGANGAGKSTFMKLVTGILQPSGGEIRVCGIPVVHKQLKNIRKKVGYTFQNPDNQLFMPSVYEDVAFAMKQKGLSGKTVEAAVVQALEQVDGLHLKDKAPHKLSGGEKRLVTLATVLIESPEMLLLDEPAVGLDPRARRQLIRLLADRQETIILTTHDMDMALELCDRIIVMYGGQIKGDDTPLNIFGNRSLLCDNHLELPLRMQGCPVCGK